MHNKIKIIRLFSMLFILVFIIFSAIAFSGEIKSLNKDKLPSKYESVVFGRVRVLTDFPRFKPAGTGCYFGLFDFHSKKEINKFKISFRNSSKRLKADKDGINGYDANFVAGAEEGDYLFRYFIFEIPNEYKVTEFISNADENEYITRMFSWINKSCNIPPNSLVYMGVIEIKFVDAEKMSEGRYEWIDFKTIRKYTMDDFETDLANFQEKYPKLYEQYKDNIVKVDWNDYNTGDEEEE